MKTATGKESGGATRLQEKLGYTYDAAGNLNYRTNDALVQTFGVNGLNELTSVSRSGTLTVAGTTTSEATSVTVLGTGLSPGAATRYDDFTWARAGATPTDGSNTYTAIAQDSYGRSDTNSVTVYLPESAGYTYDDNGNLTYDGQRAFTYDDENQLISVLVSNEWKSVFEYDGKMRRRIRHECAWSGSAWVTNETARYVYDGNLVIQERDESNIPQVTYTRGTDLSGSMQGAGGIGGLLARTDSSEHSHAFYHVDGNGNVTAMVNTNEVIVARYHYDPYGYTLSSSGPLAKANLYRFSSKEWHPNSGLVSFGYRYYDPNLQRWPNRDPIGERGGFNLYEYVRNAPMRFVDPTGMQLWPPTPPPSDLPPPTPGMWRRFLQNNTFLGGRCCNRSGGGEWALVDGGWVHLANGECTGRTSDCDGMTCGGGFYWTGWRNAECSTPGDDCGPFRNRRWTPGEQDPRARPPGGRSGRGSHEGNTPPNYEYSPRAE